MTTTIIVDSLLPRPKLNYDGGYDVAVKGVSVVVICESRQVHQRHAQEVWH